jgi:hypothetical protein
MKIEQPAGARRRERATGTARADLWVKLEELAPSGITVVLRSSECGERERSGVRTDEVGSAF